MLGETEAHRCKSHFAQRGSAADLKRSMIEKGCDYRTARPTHDRHQAAACYIGLCFREDVESADEAGDAKVIAPRLKVWRV
jgi:hypothetical protein